MVHEDFPAGVIITNGLGGDYPLIITQFYLYLVSGAIKITTANRGASGAYRPETFYPRPRYEENDDEVIWKPREDEEFEVTIKARIGSRNIERHYFVRKRTQIVVTQVLQFLNTTQTRISIIAGTITKTVKDIAISIRNLDKRS